MLYMMMLMMLLIIYIMIIIVIYIHPVLSVMTDFEVEVVKIQSQRLSVAISHISFPHLLEIFPLPRIFILLLL